MCWDSKNSLSAFMKLIDQQGMLVCKKVLFSSLVCTIIKVCLTYRNRIERRVINSCRIEEGLHRESILIRIGLVIVTNHPAFQWFSTITVYFSFMQQWNTGHLQAAVVQAMTQESKLLLSFGATIILVRFDAVKNKQK